MSDAKGFNRCEGFAGSVPQNWINANFPVCPMCGSVDPYWTLKDKIELAGNRVMFRCKDCGCILSATVADFSGATKSKAFAILTTGGLVNAISKKHAGKDVTKVYVKIEDAGDYQLDKSIEGTEVTLDDLKARSNAFLVNARGNTTTNVAPVVEEKKEEAITVSYAPVVEENSNTEFKVSYDTQATVSYANEQNTVTEEEKYVAPGFLKPFSFICAFFWFYSLICGLIITSGSVSESMLFLFYDSILLAGSILMIIGILKNPKLFGIGCCLFAFEDLLALFNNIKYSSFSFVNILTMAIYVVIGMYFIFKGKKVNWIVKLVCAIVLGLIMVISAFESFGSIGYLFRYSAFLGIEVIFNLVRAVFTTLILIFYTPYKKV